MSGDERPGLAPLIGVAAVVAFVVMFPEMMPFAFVAAGFGALGAAVVGVPFAAAAMRLGWVRWWQAALIGAIAAAISPAIGLLVLLVFRGPHSPLILVLQGAGQSVASTAWFMLPIGVATGVSYWSVYVAEQRRWLGAVIATVAAAATVAGVIGDRSRISRQRTLAWQQQHAYDSSLPAAATLLSLRLTRVMSSQEGDALFVGSTSPECGLLVHSAAIAQQIPIGAEVWTDVTQFSAATFAVVKLGAITDQRQLAKIDVWRCKPWR